MKYLIGIVMLLAPVGLSHAQKVTFNKGGTTSKIIMWNFPIHLVMVICFLQSS